MKRAVDLAKEGVGFASPNPAVGAVIVKGGKIIAEGVHKKAGSDHAEITAISKVMNGSGIVTMDIDPTLFRNADLYVTLEPCCHAGKTPSCLNAVLAADFNKVNIGMIDPFEKVRGRSVKALKEKGIKVEVCKSGSELALEVRELNQPFIKWATEGIPYVIMKTGMTLDGKIATRSGESKWITSQEAREDAGMERGKCDAVIVGYGTVAADNPELTAGGKFRNKDILRVILDGKLKSPIGSKVFRDKNVFVACCDSASKANKAKFKKAGIEFGFFGKNEVSVKKLLKFLAKRGVQSVFVEGGSNVNGSFYDAALKDRSVLDKVIFYAAPKLMGGRESLSVIGGEGVTKLSKAVTFKEFDAVKVGADLKILGTINLY